MRKMRAASARPNIIKAIAVISFLCVFIRIVASIGGNSAAEGFIAELAKNDGVTSGILRFEMGGLSGNSPGLHALLFESTALVAGLNSDLLEDTTAEYRISDAAPPENESTPAPERPSGSLFYGGLPPSELEPKATDVTDGQANTPLPASADSILVDNTTSYEIDTRTLLAESLNISLEHGKPAVLIIHTHTSEAYTPSEGEEYEPSDPFRTEDKTRNITRVGDELAAAFESRGIKVIHDRRSYDYPSYSGSYTRSYESIKSYLQKYPTIGLVIDLHRDAITAPDGSQYKTIAQIGDVTCSQVMFVVGTDSAGLQHPRWRENFKLALCLQSEMNVLSPTLTRPIRVSEYRYNQQATLGSLIVEIGCAGNTLSESLTAARYFADAASNVILGLYA